LKGVLLYLFLFGFWLNSQGQTYLGFKAGLTLSRLSFQETRNDIFDPDIDQENKAGFTAGAMLKYFYQPHAGIQIELNFTQKGWTELIDENNSFSTTLNYVEMPFLSHFYLGKKKTQWILTVGPNVGYLLSTKEGSIPPGTEGQIMYRITSDNQKRFSLGVQGGFGVSRTTSFGQLQLEGYYNISLTNTFITIPGFTPERSLNAVLGISLAYFYELPKK